MRTQVLRWTIGLAVSGVALYFAFAGIEWEKVGDALREADYALLAAAVPLLFLMILFRAQRWRLLFLPDKDVSLSSAFAALNIGYMANNVLPFQLGEIARAYLLGESEGVPKMRALSTIAVERILDTLALLLLLGVLLPFIDLPRVAAVSAVVILVVAIGAAGAIAIAVADRGRAERWLDLLVTRLPGKARPIAQQWARSILDGLSAVRRPSTMVAVIFWTALAWLTSGAILYMVIEAFSLDVPWTAAAFLLVATTFGFFVPSSPGAIGVYDAISIRALTEVYSVGHEEAASYAIVAHVLYLLPPTLLGAAFFIRHQLSVRRLQMWDRAEPSMSTPAQPAPERRTHV